MIDMDIMFSIFGNNREALFDYLESLIDNLSKLLKNVDNAIRDKNKIIALKYFHQIKGPIGTIGFKKMYALCETAEEKITKSDWDSATHLCFEMEKTLKKLEDELQQEIKTFER